MKVKVKSIRKVDGGYGINFKPFKIGDYVYLGAKVTTSKAKRIKIEVELVAKNPEGDDHRITFGLLENGTIHTLKRRSSLGVELFFKLSTIVQKSIRIARKVRSDMDNKTQTDKKDKSDSGGDKKVCMVTDCEQEAVVPEEDPVFCEEHEKIMV